MARRGNVVMVVLVVAAASFLLGGFGTAMAVKSGLTAETLTAWGTLALAIVTAALALFAYRTIEENRGLIESAKNQAEATTKAADSAREQAGAGKRAAEAAEAAAHAAERQASASAQMLAEVQFDRELAGRPYLTLSYIDPARLMEGKQLPTGQLPLSGQLLLRIQNVGRGPALGCRFVGYYSIPAETQGVPGVGDATQGTFTGGRAFYVTDTFDLSGGGEREGWAGQAVPGADVTNAIHGIFEGGAKEEVLVVLCVDQFGRKYRFRCRPSTVVPDTWPALHSTGAPLEPHAPSWTWALRE